MYPVFGSADLRPRINRNILECKDSYLDRAISRGKLVLIETYWNVKRYVDAYAGIVKMVLIETYWNVKENPELFSLEETWY